MRKHLFVIAFIAFLGLFLVPDADARGRNPHDRHHYKEQRKVKKAYYKGYKQGMREAYRYDDRRHHRGHYYGKHHRGQRRYVAVPAPPLPPRGGSVSIHIPLPPHPGFR